MDSRFSQFQALRLFVLSWLFLGIFLAACTASPVKDAEVFLQVTPISPSPVLGSPLPTLTIAPTAMREGDQPTQAGHLETTSAAGEPSATLSPSSMVLPELPGTLSPTGMIPSLPVPEMDSTWPAEGSIFWIEMHSLTDSGGLGLLTRTGARWVRRNALLWSDVEYLQGERNWQNVTRLEAELLAAAQNNLSVILIVRSAPPFARLVPGSACGAVAVESFDAFADFLAEAVTRYSYPPFNVLFWEIGNEPDIDPAQVRSDSVYGCWGDASSPYYGGDYYAEMLRVVYPRIKAANPQVQVLVGGLLLDCDPTNPPETSPGSGVLKDCSSGRYLEGILGAGGGPYFDAVSFHAYDYYGEGLGRYGNLNWKSTWNTTGPVVSAKANFLTDLLTRQD